MNKIQQEEFRILCEFDRICKAHNISYSLGYGTLIGAIRHKGFIPWDDDIDVMMTRDNYNKFLEVASNHLSDDFMLCNHQIEQKYWYPFTKIRSNNVELKEKSTDYLGIHQGVWIDIFPFDTVSMDSTERDNQYDYLQNFHRKFVYYVFTHPLDTDPIHKKLIKSSLSFYNRKLGKKDSEIETWYQAIEEECLRSNALESEFVNLLAYNNNPKEHVGSLITKDSLLDTIEVEFEGKTFSAIKDYDTWLTNMYGDYMTPPPIDKQVSVHHTIT